MFLHNGPMEYDQKEIKRVLVKNIKKFRVRIHLTQEQAAERANITTKYWQRLEMDSQIDLPSLPALFEIAKALEIKPSRLLEN